MVHFCKKKVYNKLMTNKIAEKLKLLPDKPGVYKMFNAKGELIYVGKALNLKNRVRQYFQSSKTHTEKVRAMVANIDDFDFVIVTNETEALNLECNLIKQNRPYYNIKPHPQPTGNKYTSVRFVFQLPQSTYATMLFRELTKSSSAGTYQAGLSKEVKEGKDDN